MKKSILKMMAEASEAKDDQGALPARGRRGSPVVGNVGKALNTLSESSITVLDPAKIDASPYHDRFESDSEVGEEIENLAVSIKAEGQKIPVLVRPHPEQQGRYQLAYGHRRLAAIRRLASESETPGDIRIRAYIRPLTDKELLVEQSLENGVRENLTWIEQALWAHQLREAGFSSVAIEPVLGLSKTPLSLMLKVARALPLDIVRAIGRAKGVGRPKWMTLADACLAGGEAAATRIRALVGDPAFQAAEPARRIDLAVVAARGRPEKEKTPEIREIAHGDRVVGQVSRGRAGTTISIPRSEAAFAEWLETRLDTLADEFFSIPADKNGRRD
ncbi:plasmid partitioning protein RepB [Martelella lutilitoris]|uniref:Plasmid partitioning protein RepB n=1 Tax=Martelella lutilitoris TaxID=2583532 RepID=A0A5C4JLN5_9HYPH|nr:plasmid partitioning protein RepB [Martelella lutilitoris]TNB46248.1 plasmid partitioning protein RepB [Martelella lutilitoris]